MLLRKNNMNHMIQIGSLFVIFFIFIFIFNFFENLDVYLFLMNYYLRIKQDNIKSFNLNKKLI